MGRDTKLSKVRSMLKAEIGQSLTVGTSNDQMLNQKLDNQQVALAIGYDWPFMDYAVDIAYGVAAQTVNITTELNWEHEVKAFVLYGTKWVELEYGINEEQYSIRAAGVQQSPIQRWQVTTDNKVEVWPTPATAQTVRFRGQKALTTLLTGAAYNDDATFDLDDLLVVLHVAAEMLLDLGKPSGRVKQSRAAERLARLTSNVTHTKRVFSRGGSGGFNNKKDTNHRKVVLIA